MVLETPFPTTGAGANKRSTNGMGGDDDFGGECMGALKHARCNNDVDFFDGLDPLDLGYGDTVYLV
jgi:hypothetical protein